MEMKTLLVRMLENGLPLVQARHIHAFPFGIADIREDILVIPGDIKGEEVNGVQPLAGKVVDCPGKLGSLATHPCGIAFLPVTRMGGVGFNGFLLGGKVPRVILPVRLEGAVKILVGQQIFRRIRSLLEEVFPVAGKTQVMHTDVFQSSPGAVIRCGLV